MEHENELSTAEIARLARKLFGPEEDWDDAAVDFVLRLHGIDPDESVKYGLDLILRFMDRRKQERKEIPKELLTVFVKLAAGAEREDPRTTNAQRGMEKALRTEASRGSRGSRPEVVVRSFRLKRELSAKDELILRKLQTKLLDDTKGGG